MCAFVCVMTVNKLRSHNYIQCSRREKERERERIHYFIALFVISERECSVVFFRSTFVLC